MGRIFIIIIVIAEFLSVSAYAEDLSLLVETVLSRNPRVISAQHELDAFKNKIPQASALPDPMVKYYFMGEMLETPLGPQEDMVELEQEIPYPGKLIRARRMAQADYEAAVSRLEMVRRDVVFRVKTSIYSLWSIRERLTYLKEKKNLLGQVRSSVKAGYASGVSMQDDVLMASSQMAELSQEIISLQQQDHIVSSELQALLNQTETVEIPHVIVEDDEAVGPLDVLMARLEASPDVEESSRMVQKEKSALTMARLANRPDFKIGFQYIGIGNENMGMGPEEGRDAWAIPVTVTIPFWQNRVRSGVREMENNLLSAESRQQQVRLETELELKKAYYEYEANRQMLDVYRQELIPQAQMREASAKAAYESGQQDMNGWIRSRMDLLQAKIMESQMRAESRASRAMLERIVGEL